ncbi:MAG: hypothetical protein V3T88_01305 [Nitrosomonadaceae bacterium]|jgi:hypothetical protein
MARTNYTKLYVGTDYSTAEQTTADIEGSVMRAKPMTTTQRDAITDPEAGMFIFNSTTNVLNFYNGTVWGAV